jgi:hypothetical protein
MEDEERAHRDAHFQEELESLKTSVARLTSLLEQKLKNNSGKFLPANLSSLFKPQQRLSPKKLGTNIVKSLNTIQHF